jgi:glycosyltransferase involved in cell wall biosynthesis
MPPLSAVVTTFNSAASIEATLAALDWCDEILVVDSGSSDATLAICRQYGCRVLHRDFTGFGPHKHWATEQASHDWVFVVDADEIVTDELRDEIRALLAGEGPTETGFEMAISLVFLGRLLRFGGEYNKLHLRLFDRRAGNYNDRPVHECVEVAGAVRVLRGRMLHDSYRDLEHYFEKFNRYTSSAAEVLSRRGKRASAWGVAFRLPFSFVHLYLVRGLIFDGYPGFVWALLSAFSPTVKYMKLRELNRRSRLVNGAAPTETAPRSDAKAA